MISLLLKNIWLYFMKKYFTFIERGPNSIDEKKFRFDVFVLFIEEWLRRHSKVGSSRVYKVNGWSKGME